MLLNFFDLTPENSAVQFLSEPITPFLTMGLFLSHPVFKWFV